MRSYFSLPNHFHLSILFERVADAPGSKSSPIILSCGSSSLATDNLHVASTMAPPQFYSYLTTSAQLVPPFSGKHFLYLASRTAPFPAVPPPSLPARLSLFLLPPHLTNLYILEQHCKAQNLTLTLHSSDPVLRLEPSSVSMLATPMLCVQSLL